MRSHEQVATASTTIALDRRFALLAAGAAGFTLAMIAAAHVRVPLPFSPVPLSLQTMVALLAGAMLGPGAGAASMLAYLGLGAAGLPVFTTGATLGLTAGYIVGFAAAAAIVGLAARRTRSGLVVLAAMVAGSVVIYLLGASWLALVTGMSAGKAFAVGVLPFLPGDALKLAAAFGIWRTWRYAWDAALGRRDAGS